MNTFNELAALARANPRLVVAALAFDAFISGIASAVTAFIVLYATGNLG